MALTRVVRNAAATLTHTWYVGETPTDPTGTPTIAIVDANGTSVASGNATVVGSGTGQVTAPLAAQSLTRLLTVTWTATVAGGTVVEVDQVEVVGGRLFSLAEARSSDSSLADAGKYPTADIEQARLEVEEELEEICDRSFFPRYARLVLDGTGLSDVMLRGVDAPSGSSGDFRTLRRASVATRVDNTFTDLTSGQLAAVASTADGGLRRTDGLAWYEGYRNVVVEFEFGLNGPSSDLKRAALTRLRSRLNMSRSGIPDRASSFSLAEGGTYRLDMPGEWKTGIPDVDAVYGRYSRRMQGGKPRPASRTLDYTPQQHSLFHRSRGRR